MQCDVLSSVFKFQFRLRGVADFRGQESPPAVLDAAGCPSRVRERKSCRPPKGMSQAHNLTSTCTGMVPFWQLCPPALFSGGGNPMGFPFITQHANGSWAYPSYPTIPQLVPGGLPPWCNLYGSTMNTDPSASMINKPKSVISGPLTGSAISGPFTWPALSSTPARPIPYAVLDWRRPDLSTASKLYISHYCLL